jgi:glycine oxidase
LAEEECQVRNPRHLKALVAGCRHHGVAIESDVEVTGFWTSGRQVVGAQTTCGPRFAAAFCITSGAWAARLAESWNLALAIKPIRGQMVLFRDPSPGLNRIVNIGKRYLVPRRDGRVLAGSTEEDIGFDRQTSDEGIAGLLKLARELIPAWCSAEVERTWAGLRPATPDGLPYLCRAPDLDNAFLAAGHFRSGIYLSPATAIVMSELVRNQPPSVDLSPFHSNRRDGSL